MLAPALIALIALLECTAHAGGVCRPDGPCTACKDCTRCQWCVSGKGSCSVCQNQTGAQQKARDAKRPAHYRESAN